MAENDRTLRLIQLRSLALGNQIVLQIAVPALFILRSDLNHYGLWLAINSYSSFITFLDLGFFAVIPTSAIVQTSRNLSGKDQLHLIAMRKYSMRLSITGIFSLLSMWYFGRLLDVNLVNSIFFTYAILSAINVFLLLVLRYYEASYRSVNSIYGFSILTIHAIASTISTISVLYFKGTIMHILIFNLIISIVFLLQYRIKGDAFVTDKNHSVSVIQSLKKFLRPGIGYQLFSIGYMIINQGIIIIIQNVGNYEVLGKLGVIRAITGVLRQISSVLVNSSIPQLSLLLKAGKLDEAGIRFRSMKKLIYLSNSCILLVLLIGLLSYFFQGISTINEIPIILCIIFLLSAAFDIPWNIWLILPLSVNSHTNLGLRFLFSSLLTLLLTIPAYEYIGLAGIAIILLIQDLVMTGQTIRQGKQILGQT